MQITKMLVPQSKWDIKCPYEMNAEFIVIHNTANKASAMAEMSYMIGNNDKVSYHCAVDDYRIVQGVEFNRNTWNAGDGKKGNGNRKGIAIEICYSTGDLEQFKNAEKLCAEYVAYLLKQFGWGIDKVKKHQDFSGKYCPHKTLDLGWERFLNMVKSYMEIQSQPKQEIKSEGELEMARVYQNGSTSEPVFADTSLTKKIGSLDPREKAEYLSIDNDRPLVRYKVNGTNTYKCGYVRWKGGAK